MENVPESAVPSVQATFNFLYQQHKDGKPLLEVQTVESRNLLFLASPHEFDVVVLQIVGERTEGGVVVCWTR
jgi:hypothetical protein